jgi:hypothetical protein
VYQNQTSRPRAPYHKSTNNTAADQCPCQRWLHCRGHALGVHLLASERLAKENKQHRGSGPSPPSFAYCIHAADGSIAQVRLLIHPELETTKLTVDSAKQHPHMTSLYLWVMVRSSTVACSTDYTLSVARRCSTSSTSSQCGSFSSTNGTWSRWESKCTKWAAAGAGQS